MAAPLTVPFDFSDSEIVLSVTVAGTPVLALLDTGVDPSVIDVKLAESLKLPLDSANGGEVSGQGGDASAVAYPATIAGLALKGRPFPPVEALAHDLSGISAHLGKPLGVVLGYSFLEDKILLVDYAKSEVTFLDKAAEANKRTMQCRNRWIIPLKGFPEDATPAVLLRFGEAHGLISLDTGSSGTLTIYPGTLNLAGVKDALVEKGEVTGAGARGTTLAKSYVLNLPIQLGPFTAPAGLTVTLHEKKDFDDSRVANAGNKFFSSLGLKILLDYRSKRLGFYGDC